MSLFAETYWNNVVTWFETTTDSNETRAVIETGDLPIRP